MKWATVTYQSAYFTYVQMQLKCFNLFYELKGQVEELMYVIFITAPVYDQPKTPYSHSAL